MHGDITEQIHSASKYVARKAYCPNHLQYPSHHVNSTLSTFIVSRWAARPQGRLGSPFTYSIHGARG